MRMLRYLTTMALATITIFVFAGQGPTISFDKQVYDYGKIRYGDTVTEELPFTNTGDEPLIIESVRSACGCTRVAKASTKIPPGGTSKITVTFETTGLRAGKKEQSVTVQSNDPKHPVVKLAVQAEVIRDIVVEPPIVAKDFPAFVDTVSIPMYVSNSSSKDVTLKAVKSEAEGVSAHLKPATVVAPPGDRTPFTLVLNPKKEAERRFYCGKLSILTDHPRESEAEVRYLLKFGSSK
jgi:hypothetical protein